MFRHWQSTVTQDDRLELPKTTSTKYFRKNIATETQNGFDNGEQTDEGDGRAVSEGRRFGSTVGSRSET